MNPDKVLCPTGKVNADIECESWTMIEGQKEQHAPLCTGAGCSAEMGEKRDRNKKQKDKNTHRP